jgi:hypothetical protein
LTAATAAFAAARRVSGSIFYLLPRPNKCCAITAATASTTSNAAKSTTSTTTTYTAASANPTTTGASTATAAAKAQKEWLSNKISSITSASTGAGTTYQIWVSPQPLNKTAIVSLRRSPTSTTC